MFERTPVGRRPAPSGVLALMRGADSGGLPHDHLPGTVSTAPDAGVAVTQLFLDAAYDGLHFCKAGDHGKVAVHAEFLIRALDLQVTRSACRERLKETCLGVDPRRRVRPD